MMLPRAMALCSARLQMPSPAELRSQLSILLAVLVPPCAPFPDAFRLGNIGGWSITTWACLRGQRPWGGRRIRMFSPGPLISSVALLDLVSSEWLDRFVIEAAARRLPVYVALTFDGRISLEPSEAFDHDLVAAFKAHQRSDKGFGPALGPTAGERAADGFAHFGYAVVEGRSDWMLEPKDAKLQDAVFCAWAELNTLTLPPDVIAKWLALRRDRDRA